VLAEAGHQRNGLVSAYWLVDAQRAAQGPDGKSICSVHSTSTRRHAVAAIFSSFWAAIAAGPRWCRRPIRSTLTWCRSTPSTSLLRFWNCIPFSRCHHASKLFLGSSLNWSASCFLQSILQPPEATGVAQPPNTYRLPQWNPARANKVQDRRDRVAEATSGPVKMQDFRRPEVQQVNGSPSVIPCLTCCFSKCQTCRMPPCRMISRPCRTAFGLRV
jgi:hypothetical protein